MYSYSRFSLSKLLTVHKDLRTVFLEAINSIDIRVYYGYRSAEEQFKLFKKGREKVNGAWTIIDKSKIVTYLDGYKKKSDHQSGPPSTALDAVVYPVDWSDKLSQELLNNIVQKISDKFIKEKKIKHKILWGGNWESFYDAYHWYIEEKK